MLLLLCYVYINLLHNYDGHTLIKAKKSILWEIVLSVHREKQTLQSYPILKIVINLAWENVLSVHTEKNKHFKVS